MAFNQFPAKGGVPSGTTANRPSSPASGDVYYNGDLGLLEIYTTSGWQPCSAPSGTPTIVLSDSGPTRAYTDGPAFKIDFTASTLGGFPTGYTANATSTVTSSVYTGLTSTSSTITIPTFSGSAGYGASYTVNGASYNGFGASPYANGAIIVTTKPQTPTIGTVVLSSNSSTDVSVTWTLNATGGSPLTAVKVKTYNGATLVSTTTAATTSSTSVTVTGLSTGITYTFKVVAANANGDSPESSGLTLQSIAADYLIVAGGGGGGNSNGSAGSGAGGMKTGTLYFGGTTTITVGAGGAGTASTSTKGGNGVNSVFGSISATGGGGSGTEGGQNRGADGGSGGGSVRTNDINNYGSGISGEGSNGGANYPDGSPHYAGGGGGGKGAAGATGSNSGGGAGGIGATSSITGTSTYYAGGGGAGYYNSGSGQANGGSGGNGGGAGGGTNPSDGRSRNGDANTGGGAGSNGLAGQAGGNGGSGIVVIAYPDSNPAITTIPGTLTYSQPTRSGYRVYKFTAGTGTITL